MPFEYYQRLKKRERAIYDESDARKVVPVLEPAAVRALLPDVEAALASGDRTATARATRRFVDALLSQLGAPPVVVRVLAVRPSDEDAELHGLYELEEGKKAVVRVWMRTAARREPVAFRTFVRTVLHELCHHLDFTLYALPISFHTEGFFQRESHLARQLLPPSTRRAAKKARAADEGRAEERAAGKADVRAKAARPRKRRGGEQMTLL